MFKHLHTHCSLASYLGGNHGCPGYSENGPMCCGCYCPPCSKCPHDEWQPAAVCSLCNVAKDCWRCSDNEVQNIKQCDECRELFCLDCRPFDDGTATCSVCALPLVSKRVKTNDIRKYFLSSPKKG